MAKATIHLTWEFAPFYRRWQGWRRVLWWAWPVRWMVVEEGRGYAVTDYFCTANEAATWMCKRVTRDD